MNNSAYGTMACHPRKFGHLNHSREYRSKPMEQKKAPRPQYHLFHGKVGEVFDCVIDFRIKDSCPRHSHSLPAGTRFMIHEVTGTEHKSAANATDMVRYTLMSFGCFHKILYNALNSRRCKKRDDNELVEP